MKVFLLLAVAVLIHANYATLLIKGPTEPVLEGQKVTLECEYTDTELNISQVRVERSRSPNGPWFPAYTYYSICMLQRSRVDVERIGNRLLFPITYAQPYGIDVFYRCASTNKNVTAPDNSSQALRFKVHYLRYPRVTSGGNRVSESLKVEAGDDVVLKCATSSSETPTITWTKNGSDWILPSSTLTLEKISELDAGLYTCSAEHPLLPSLSRKESIKISVFTEELPWYRTSSGELWATMAAVAVCFLIFILSVSIFLCRRFGTARTSKGPIDDHSQKKPIYKTSVDSLPSACGDSQPLV